MEELQLLERDLFEARKFWEGRIDDFDRSMLNNPVILEILADKRMVDTVRKYDGDATTVGQIARWLVVTTYYLKDKGAVVRMVDTVNRYDGDYARRIADELAWAAYYLRSLEDKDGFVRIADAVGKYDGDAAVEIAGRLTNATAIAILNDNKKINRLVSMLDTVGKSIFDILNNSELYDIFDLGLDALVKDRTGFDAVASYIKSGRRLPAPTESNMEDYKKIALDYVKSNYGIAKDIGMNHLLMLFAVGDDVMGEAVGLVNGSMERDCKHYSLKASDSKPLQYGRDELIRYSVVSIVGSKDKGREKEAMDAVASIVGEKAVNRARNEFNSKHRHLMKDIVSAFSQSDYDKAYDILRQTEDEAIADVLNAADYKDVNIGNANFVKAVESKNPLDYDNRVQIACVYLPAGAKDKDILEYCRDGRFTLVRYDVGGSALGSAICYSENDVFLVDSVEGHRSFRKPEIFEIVYNDLVARAKGRKAGMIVFNKNAYNETSREFIGHLKTKNLKEGNVRMELDTDGYLEANEEVDGYVVGLRGMAE